MRSGWAVTTDHPVPRTRSGLRAASRGPFYFAWGCFRDFVSGPCGVPHECLRRVRDTGVDAQGSHDRAPLRALVQVWSSASIPQVNEPAGRRKHEKQDHRPLRIPCTAEGRGRHASVRQSRHHRTADHARAEGPSRPHLCDGDAGEPCRRHGRRFQPRLGQARRLQRPCRARPRQCDGLALQRQLHRHADDPDRRPAGAGPRPDGAGALRPAGADGASRW